MIDPGLEREILSDARSPNAEKREQAFERLVALVHGPLLALCMNITQNRADAEDAVQETYVAAHRAIAGFRGESRLVTWLYRIAIRAAVRQRSAQRRHAARPLRLEAMDSRGAVDSERPTTERIQRALASLSVEHRTVLALFCVEQLSHERIAGVLGVPIGTVWSRLHNARKRLVAAFERQHDTRPATTVRPRD